MLPTDERLKSFLLGKLEPNGRAHFVVERYWEQAMLYLLIVPLQWLHLAHFLATTTWDEYSSGTRLLVVVYLGACLKAWELVRILAYKFLVVDQEKTRQLALKYWTTQATLARAQLDKLRGRLMGTRGGEGEAAAEGGRRGQEGASSGTTTPLTVAPSPK